MLAALAAALAALAPATLADDGAWSWFADPRAVYAGHHTYAGWLTSGGDVVVAAYDHGSGTAAGRIVAPRFEVDDHANPAVYVRRDGRIAAFWSAHSGPQMYQRVTTRPHDVTAWGPVQAVGTNTPGPQGYTYPNPVRLTDRLWLFWRGGSGQPTYSASADDGGTWAPARTLLSVPGQRPYVKYAASGDTIHVAFTEGNPDAFNTSLYYAALRNGRFHRADGSVIAAPPIAPAQADRVHDAASAPRAWVHDVAADAAGRPVIVYATFPSNADHRYRYARWTGTAWLDRELTAAGPSFPDVAANGKYSGGIVLDHEDPSVVWLSRSAGGGHHALERWHTPDGGATWSNEPVTAPADADDVRPVTPRGLPAGLATEALWMHGAYVDYTHYRTSLMGLGVTTAAIEPLAEPAPAAAAAPPALARRASRVTIGVRRVRGRARIRGRLLDPATRAGLRGRRVTLEARRRGARRYKRVATLTTGFAGRLRHARRLRVTTRYRLRFVGEAGYAPSRSRSVRLRSVKAQARYNRPRA